VTTQPNTLMKQRVLIVGTFGTAEVNSGQLHVLDVWEKRKACIIL